MNICHGDLWHHLGEYDAICITTNGKVKKDGSVVMGAGIAKQAKDKFHGIAYIIGKYIRLRGNEPHVIDMNYFFELDMPNIVTFPVKHHWKERADLILIKISAEHLLHLLNKNEWERVALPAPGVGNGKRDWETDVKPIIEKVFGDDDRIDIWFYR